MNKVLVAIAAAAAERAADPTISDGQWEVGVDVPAGVYKVKEAITRGNCYWKIGPSGDPGKIHLTVSGTPLRPSGNRNERTLIGYVVG